MPKVSFSLLLAVASLCPMVARAQTPLIGIGDSLGEGVQSANAFLDSQPSTYLNRIARQMNVPFQQPLLSTSPFAFIYTDAGRSRLQPSAVPSDLAVSGATTHDVLFTTANPTPVTETDLVLPPYFGLSQIQIVEQAKPALVISWVGTDDLIGEVLNFTTLDQPDPTPLPVFTAEYHELITRLQATGAQVVVGNIPDLTKIAWLFDNAALEKYTGVDYNLPAGTVTTLPTMILLKLGVVPAAVLKSPAFTLTGTQLVGLRAQIREYNQVIESAAAQAGFPVVDTYGILDLIAAHPIVLGANTISTAYNGGGFSLDGVHPSNTGHAIFANAFISAANSAYQLNIPAIPDANLLEIVNSDPFVDTTGQGVVPGRPLTGLLETLGPMLGLSRGVSGAVTPARKVSAADFMRSYYAAKGVPASASWTNDDVIAAVRDMLGLKP